MQSKKNTQSEVAQLLEQLDREYQSSQWAVTGISHGMARHLFINRRMQKIGNIHIQLRDLVGDDAIVLINRRLEDHQQQTTS